MDKNNNVGGCSYQDLTRFVENGSLFFTNGDYPQAAYCFRDARDASIQLNGECSLETAILHYKYGLCLRCRFPVPENDPMDLVPKELDYYQSLVLGSPSSAFKRYRGDMEEKYIRMLAAAKGELNRAWSIAENQ